MLRSDNCSKQGASKCYLAVRPWNADSIGRTMTNDRTIRFDLEAA